MSQGAQYSGGREPAAANVDSGSEPLCATSYPYFLGLAESWTLFLTLNTSSINESGSFLSGSSHGLRQPQVLGNDLVTVVGLTCASIGPQVPTPSGGIQVLYRSPVVGQLRSGSVAFHLPVVAVYASHGPVRCQVLHAQVVIGAVRINSDDIVPGHVKGILLPDLDQFVGMPLLDLQPFLLSMSRSGRSQLLVLENVLSRRSIGRVSQAMATYCGSTLNRILTLGLKPMHPLTN